MRRVYLLGETSGHGASGGIAGQLGADVFEGAAHAVFETNGGMVVQQALGLLDGRLGVAHITGARWGVLDRDRAADQLPNLEGDLHDRVP